MHKNRKKIIQIASNILVIRYFCWITETFEMKLLCTIFQMIIILHLHLLLQNFQKGCMYVELLLVKTITFFWLNRINIIQNAKEIHFILYISYQKQFVLKFFIILLSISSICNETTVVKQHNIVIVSLFSFHIKISSNDITLI